MTKVYWINVLSCTERAEHMVSQLDQLQEDHVRIDAFTPDTIPIKELRTSSYAMSPPEIACTYSHVKAMETGVRGGSDFFVVMEDDIVLPWKYNWKEIAAQGPEDWEILQLFTSNASRIQQNIPKFPGQLFAPRVTDDWGTACYMIKSSAAKRILETYQNGIQTFEPIGLRNYSAPLADNLVYSKCVTYVPTFPLMFCRDKDSLIHPEHLRTHQWGTVCIVLHLRTFFDHRRLWSWVEKCPESFTPVGGYAIRFDPRVHQAYQHVHRAFGICFLPEVQMEDGTAEIFFYGIGPFVSR